MLPHLWAIPTDGAGRMNNHINHIHQVGEPDAYTLEEVQARKPGLDEDFACNWAVTAMTRADWNRLQAYLIDYSGWAGDAVSKVRFMQERLRARSDP